MEGIGETIDTDTDTDTDTDMDTDEHVFVLSSIPPEGVVLREAGVYRFSNNIAWRPALPNTTALRVACDGVTIDLSNYSLTLVNADPTCIAISATGSLHRPVTKLKVCCGEIKTFGSQALHQALVFIHVHSLLMTRVVVRSSGTRRATASSAIPAGHTRGQAVLISGCTRARVLWCAFESLFTALQAYCCIRVESSSRVTMANVSMHGCHAMLGCRFFAGVFAMSSSHVKLVKCHIGSIVGMGFKFNPDALAPPVAIHSIFAGLYLRSCVNASVVACQVAMIEASDMGVGSVYGMYLQDCSSEASNTTANTGVFNCHVHDIRADGDTQHAAGVAVVACKRLQVVRCSAARVTAPKQAVAFASSHCVAVAFHVCSAAAAAVGFGYLCDRKRWQRQSQSQSQGQGQGQSAGARFIGCVAAPDCGVAFGGPCTVSPRRIGMPSQGHA